MSLLRDIQSAAIDTKTPLTVLLRMCTVLAARLGNLEFKDWVQDELNGYKNKEDLPPYRILLVNSKGNFVGSFQSGLRNADIPLMCVPEAIRERLSHTYLMEPIASLESLVSQTSSGTAQEPWNPDIVARVGENIYQGMNCIQAWKVIPINRIVSVIDTVRTRILNFVVEIESEAPDAGEAPLHSYPVAPEKVHQIFNTFITGNVQNLASGNRDVEQTSNINADSLEILNRLILSIEKCGASSKEIEELVSIVKEMRQAKDAIGFKERYSAFMGFLADHMQVFGPVVAPYLPLIAGMLP